MDNINNLTHYFFRKNDAITLEQIKTFMCVYELKSISQAAIATFKTKPAVTHSINKLEERLGAKLLERNRGKAVSFTETGHNFYHTICPALVKLLFELDGITHGDSISVGVCDEVSNQSQIAIVNMLRAHTGRDVRMVCDFSVKLEKMVDDGRLSFAIIKRTHNQQSQTNHQLLWVANQLLDFCDGERLSVVSAHSGCVNRNVLENVLNRAGRNYHFTYSSNNLSTQAEMILNGMGVGVLSSAWQQQYPSLVVLGAEQGFPQLPQFDFVCIGKKDNVANKKIFTLLEQAISAM